MPNDDDLGAPRNGLGICGHQIPHALSQTKLPTARLYGRIVKKISFSRSGSREVSSFRYGLNSYNQAASRPDWTTLRSNLESAFGVHVGQSPAFGVGQSPLSETLHQLDAALVRRSADPIELYADRVGLLGPRWLEVLQSLGVGTTQAEQLLHGISRTLFSGIGTP